LNIEVDLAQVQSQGFSNVSYLEFKVSNNASQGSSAIVYADDFRVHPLSSPIQSKIFDLKSGQMIAVLDKENYATKMFYDDAGKLKATFKETKNGFIKTIH
jgi:hypothetical protein